jgi:Ca2+-binding RTX toxin-like protein
MRHTTTIESLERRRLLAVAFSAADLAGTFALFGEGVSGRGSVTFDAAGNLTGGSYVDEAGLTLRFKSGVLAVAPDGTTSGFLKTTHATDPIARVLGSFNSTKDVVALSDTDGTAADVPMFFFVRRAASLTNADVAGTWRVGELGSVTFDNAGHVTAGHIGNAALGFDVDLTGGAYAIGAGGTVSGHFDLVVPDFGDLRVDFAADLNRAKDVAGITLSSPDADDISGVIPMVRTGGAPTTADVVGSWRLTGNDWTAQVNFDGAGHVTGGTRGRTGDTGSAGGTYQVLSDGSISGVVTVAGTTPFVIDFEGSLNRSKNVASAFITTGAGSDVDGVILVRADGAFATLSGGTLAVTGTPAADVTGVSARSGYVNVTQNGVTQKFVATTVQRVQGSMLEGNDRMSIGAQIGAVTLDGGAGKDTLVGGDGNDVISGGIGNDSVVGGNGFDTLYGNDGNDRLEGQGNGDSLRGGRGNDTLLGGTSNDKLFGEGNDDSLDGGAQDDRLDGGFGIDALLGNLGNDLLLARDDAADILDGGDGTDAAQVDGFDTQRTGIEQLLA